MGHLKSNFPRTKEGLAMERLAVIEDFSGESFDDEDLNWKSSVENNMLVGMAPISFVDVAYFPSKFKYLFPDCYHSLSSEVLDYFHMKEDGKYTCLFFMGMMVLLDLLMVPLLPMF